MEKKKKKRRGWKKKLTPCFSSSLLSLGRIQETDQSVPVLYPSRSSSAAAAASSSFLYYTRTEEGKEYKIYCRKKKEAEEEEEMVLFDGNQYAKENGLEYVSLGAYEPSPDNTRLALTLDTTGNEIYTLMIKVKKFTPTYICLFVCLFVLCAFLTFCV